MTYECITAIRKTTDDYEIIIIDNGSDPAFEAPFGEFMEITVIRNDENKGFSVAANQGIRAAKGDVICLFNNDIFVTPGWAYRLIDWLDEYDIVAPMTNEVAGIQKTVINTYQNLDELNEASEEFSVEYEGLSQEVNWAIVSMFIKRNIFDDIGYLDESLWPSCGEDIDFCLRARKAGYRIGIAHDVYVHHERSRTFEAMQNAGLTDYNKVIEQSAKHLAKTWGKDFWNNQIVDDKQRVTASGGLRLNLGCGRFKMDGFVNIDQLEIVEPDLVADATKLCYEPNSVDEIYCGHLLEHLSWDEGQIALKHWLDILKPRGTIRVVVPNFDVLAKRYLDCPSSVEMKHLNDYYIYSYVQDSPHRYFYSERLLKEAMESAGFKRIEMLPVDHPYFVEVVDWQVGFVGVKP